MYPSLRQGIEHASSFLILFLPDTYEHDHDCVLDLCELR